MPLDYSQVQFEFISHMLFIRIQSVYDTLKTAERKAADYILRFPREFIRNTISESAKAAGVSEATFVRIAKKLGYPGFPELKQAAENTGEQGPSSVIGIEVTGEQDPLDVMHKIFDSSVQALKDTASLVDPDAYTRALDALTGAGRIEFVGTGDAYTVAYTGYLRFTRAGFRTGCHMDFDLQLIAVSQLQKGDVLVVISYSGRTKTTMDLVKAARYVGATVLLITNFPLSPLAKASDIVLCTATFTPISSGEVMSKRVPELCMMESLYANALIRDYQTFSGHRVRSEAMLNLNKYEAGAAKRHQ